MNYEFDFEQPNADAYDRRSTDGADGARVGGLRHTPVGSFGIDRPAPEPIYATVTRKINPNFVLGGVIAVGGLWMLSSLVTSLGQANPNNQMLQSQQVTAEANSTALTATTDALKAVANQRPSCIAFVCNNPAAPSQPQQYPQYVEPPFQPVQTPPVEEENYLPTPAPTPTPIAVPTDATTVAFWQYHMGDQPYIDEWHRFCSANWDIQPECQALRTALTNQFTHQ